MKKALFAAVATSLFFFAACGNNNGTTAEGKENNESKEQKEAVKIPANFTQYDGPHFTMSYPNDMHSTFDSDETINYSNEDGSMKFDASFSASGTHKNQLKEAGENYVYMKQQQGAEVISDPVVKDNTMTVRLREKGMINNFFVVSGEGSHCVSGSVKYPEDKASVFDAYVASIVASIKVK